MKTPEYLDAIRAKHELPSDYAVAKILGISRSAISNYRNNDKNFDDEVARRVAALLGISPEIVVLDMHAERAQTEEMRALWMRISEKISASFNTLIRCATPHRSSFSG